MKYDEIIARAEMLKSLHEIMMNMNNENAYDEWIVLGVPDGATEEDFVEMSEDRNEWIELINLFATIYNRYKEDELK